MFSKLKTEPDRVIWPQISLGLVEDILEKASNCPFCYKVISELGGRNTPSVGRDRAPLSAVVSWRADGVTFNTISHAQAIHFPTVALLQGDPTLDRKSLDLNNWGEEYDSDDSEPAAEFVVIPQVRTAPATTTSRATGLCDVCRALELSAERFIVLPGDKDTGDESDKLDISLGLVQDIRKKSTCPFCRLVIAALGENEVPAKIDGEMVHVLMSWNNDGVDPLNEEDPASRSIPQIRILRPYVVKESGRFVESDRLPNFPEITLVADDAPASAASTALLVRPIKQDQIDFKMVKNWLSLCERHHGKSCSKSQLFDHEITDPASEIPSFRLIDVINSCIVRGPIKSKYVALSYVWGKTDFLKALKGNIRTLEQRGSLLLPNMSDRIPLTIKDAMQLVRELGMRYLWVDCLCIIQDDDSVGKTDAISKMDHVYGAAFITIQAATGIDATSGLPGVRLGSRGRKQVLEEVIPGVRLGYKWSTDDFEKESVYHTRAWTFQEQELSRRSLIFCGGQVFFTCNEAGEWTEDVVCELDTETTSSDDDDDESSDDIGDFEGLIQKYSALALSYQSDIYNAFAGLTRYFKKELKANLCHGIPDAYFDWFLLWTPIEPQVRRENTPSWSWSGWIGGSWPRIWDWYNRNITMVRRAHRKRTWIIWYERVAHNSTTCVRVWTPKNHSSSSKPKNFYGGAIQDRFPLNCKKTLPTPKTLNAAPEYYRDILSPTPRSGFLQFWTVSLTFKLDEPQSSINSRKEHDNKLRRVEFFGRDGQEIGIVFIPERWYTAHVPGEHEFILLCEGRDQRAGRGREDEEKGWKYMVMLLEWHGEWAERVSLGSIEKDYLNQALGAGPLWKEIILG
ncbi:heterokaryon incompatibility protein-domain-containing protein [Crucibulum laeve]|uniref:Heterokaryon incompatibility protein-domain-containing protein n=1 Tax=Crucibulum laeve TaxID=68775 RepID=A0A5C3LPJ6_9AGAR|nr:heterokaryon incompatibility protein-domain-containing protein [Crucibulum laeve]